MLGLPRFAKRLLALAVDVCFCVLTVGIALSLSVGAWVVPSGAAWWALVGSVLIALPLFAVFGLYRTVYRYGNGSALVAVWHASVLYALSFGMVFTLIGIEGVPRTLGVIQPLLLMVAVGTSRAFVGHWLGGGYRKWMPIDGLPNVLIYGAGSAGQQLSQAVSSNGDMRVVGFLDDDSRLHGGVVGGLPVFSSDDLVDRVRSLEVGTILLALPSVSRKRRNEILDVLLRLRVAVRTLPSLADLAQGRVQTGDLRELDIEDLLGRDAVPPNDILLSKNVLGKVVLVTGAGGSIGSELCRQIVRTRPATLLLVESNEFALYSIHSELLGQLANHAGPEVRVVPLLASVRDERRMREIMRAWRPATLDHAAAYKHVPLVEHNATEGVKNNAIGTWVTARVAAEQGVSDFVLVSTDKAVRPTNIMGASKRLAEMVLQALAREVEDKPDATRFSMVRFGNVLGSSGSVVPLFRQQIKRGGPITLTHLEITRYFMTIPEAAQLVLQAGAMGSGGDVFVLDMGAPVKIRDLARRMVELSGMTVRDADNPEGDIAIEVTGLRPAEKLYEELLIGDNPLPTNHPRIMKAHEDFLHWPELSVILKALTTAVEANDLESVSDLLQQAVRGYNPSSELVDWVHMERVAERMPEALAAA
ncbi:nucleoside-diphosphate sugar epimerase/dehydratase [Variovorax sp. J22R24]|uniref:polysaccharide biosynthesis protein n=1 Tax=Variovorax gracilis TaxID=3053502 RepID=UPI0025782EA2|nr:nucleoside-diphosphate sugar epimerase/dehydratase [Variovorax sp. J22R24]MDM0103671.1 nucleoside-diphosphate sugar epimerase/dehydratase [Variovorax sp. J22R24]